MPDGTVSVTGLAKHFRIVANLEYLLDFIEGVAQGRSYEDESSKRSSTSRTGFLTLCHQNILKYARVLPIGRQVKSY